MESRARSDGAKWMATPGNEADANLEVPCRAVPSTPDRGCTRANRGLARANVSDGSTKSRVGVRDVNVVAISTDPKRCVEGGAVAGLGSIGRATGGARSLGACGCTVPWHVPCRVGLVRRRGERTIAVHHPRTGTRRSSCIRSTAFAGSSARHGRSSSLLGASLRRAVHLGPFAITCASI